MKDSGLNLALSFERGREGPPWGGTELINECGQKHKLVAVASLAIGLARKGADWKITVREDPSLPKGLLGCGS